MVDAFDRAVRYLRVSLTDRCNLRCTYCMPEEGIDHLPRARIASLEEVREIVAAFVEWGVVRVRLTGGEPTVRRDFVHLVETLASLVTVEGTPLEVVMTTNGTRLRELAQPLRSAGLSALTLSVDSLRPDRFAQITRRDSLDTVLAGLEAAEAAGFTGIKINTVVVAGFNDDELGALCRFAWDRGHVPRFIELMPMSAGRLFAPGTLLPAAQIRDHIAADLGTTLSRDDGEGVRGMGPARYHRVDDGQYAGRRVGTIAAMTENFCDGCNRVRLDATGSMRPCLARDDQGNLREALRLGGRAALASTVRAMLAGKRERHGFEQDGSGGPQAAMISIGG
jgi:cyclic pyranopterin phosphate synthase